MDLSGTIARLSDGTTLPITRKAPGSYVNGRYVPSTKQVDITPVLHNSHLYTATINGTAFTFMSDVDATAKEIVEGIKAAINLGAEPVTAAENDVKVTLTADTEGGDFTLVTLPADWTEVEVKPAGTSTVTLAAGTWAIQPMASRDLQQLPEGRRTAESKSLWSTVVLKVEPDPDYIVYLGKTYMVVALKDWKRAGNYYKYGLVKAEPQ